MTIPASFALLLLAADADPALTDLDRRVLAAMPASLEAGPVLVHYDPAALSVGRAEQEGERALAALRRLERDLEVRFEGRAHLFLHRNEEAFRAATGAPQEWGAFASGPRSVHLPWGAPVVHEMTHLVAHLFEGAGDRDPGGLLREGLAVAMEGEDRRVPVVSWAAVYARLGLLPPVADLRDRWPAGPPRGAHPYHAAGAFVRWLLDTAGPGRVKALYAAPDRPAEALGRGWADLEAEWRAWLQAREVPAAEEDAVRRALGLPVALLPERLRAAAGEPLPASGWIGRRPGAWRPAGDGTLRGGSDEGWAVVEAGRAFPPGAAFRVRARVLGEASLLLSIGRREGASDEALLTPGGSLVTVEGGEGGFVRTGARLVPGRWTEILLMEERGAALLYLDGRLVLRAAGAFREGGGSVGVGVSGGAAEVADARVLLPGPP